MTSREKTLIFETLELLRLTASRLPEFRESDWKSVDDWVFSELNFTANELEALYAGRGKSIYTGSAIEGAAPAGLTYEELLPFVGHPLHCIEGPNSIVQVIADDVPGKPVLFTNGDVPEIGKEDLYIGLWLELHASINQNPENAFLCLETEDGHIVHFIKAEN